jgi:hypothetical protein
LADFSEIFNFLGAALESEESEASFFEAFFGAAETSAKHKMANRKRILKFIVIGVDIAHF